MSDQAIDTTEAVVPTRLGRSSIAAVVVNMAGSGLRLVLQVVLARSLGVSGYGRFVLGRSWGELGARFPNQGWELTAVKELPAYARAGDNSHFRGFLRASWRSTAWAGLVLTGIAVAAYTSIAGRPDHAIVVGLLLATPLALTYLGRAFLQGHHRYVTGSMLVELFQPLVFGAVVAVLWATDHLTVVSALWTWIATMALAALVSRVVLRRGLGDAITSATPVEDRERWRSARLPLYASHLAIVVLDYADILIVGAVLEPADVGTYAVATRIVVLGRLVVTGVQSAAASHLAAAASTRDWDETQRIVDRSLRVCALPSVIITAVAALLAGRIVELFGDGYGGAATVLRILLIGNLVNSITGPSAAVVSLSGLEVVYARIMWAAAAAALVAVSASTAAFGVAGAAWAATAVMVAWNIALLVVARRRLGVRCWVRPTTFRALDPHPEHR
jgi:O-antigen/teichoic acid export membrane protein